MGMDFTIKVNDQNLYSVEVGGELAVTLTLDGGDIKMNWANNWGTWQELHSHPKFKELVQTCEGIVQKSTQGMKGGAKGSSKGAGK